MTSFRDLYWGHCSILSMLMTFLYMWTITFSYLFADDNKLYARIASFDDCYRLQSDLDLTYLTLKGSIIWDCQLWYTEDIVLFRLLVHHTNYHVRI